MCRNDHLMWMCRSDGSDEADPAHLQWSDRYGIDQDQGLSHLWQSGNLAIWHSGIWAIQQSGDQAIWLRQSGNLGNPPRPRVVRFSRWGRSVFDLGSMFRHSAANSAPFWGRSSVDLDMALFGTLSQEIHEI